MGYALAALWRSWGVEPEAMVDYLVDRIGLERHGATSEVRRYVGDSYGPLYQCGYLIGGIRIGSFSLGPVAGVLFAGLFLGHFDFRMSPGAQAVGFALFIFSVGYQAGPRFFDVLRADGLKYFLLAVVIAATGFSIAVIATQLLSLAPGTSADRLQL